MTITTIRELHLKTQGASEFASLLLDALGSKTELSRGTIADIYQAYVKGKMACVEQLIDTQEAA